MARPGLLSILCLCIAPIGIGSLAEASDGAALTQKEGISILTQRLSDRVSLCIGAKAGLKVSSEFGIEFNVESGSPAAWKEHFPKLVTGPGWYFTLPKRVDLMTRASPAGQRLRVELGACSLAARECNTLEFVLTVPQAQDEPIPCGE